MIYVDIYIYFNCATPLSKIVIYNHIKFDSRSNYVISNNIVE